ncbi:MAG: 2-isopropylmalate synthase [Kiritimatiellae bacterium]|nr:2-isopropylmalate synthase [Kiritimatiellia bacterium]
MNDTVRFFDTTLRDGEQAPGYSMNLEEKIRMARQLEVLGVDVVEAGFPVASPDDFEAVRSIAGELKEVTVAALSRALVKDIDAAHEAVKKAARPRIHTFLATSDLHLRYKLHMTREEALEQVGKMVAYARGKCPDIEFSAEDAFRTDRDFLCRVVESAIRAGASVINLPDTVGYAVPEEFGRMVADVRNRVPNMDRAVLSVHCHDDLGLAVANSLAGIANGARQVEGCVCGIGERAGNAAIEEVVMALRTRHDHFGDLGYRLRTEQICKTARVLAAITGVKIAPNKAIVGANAFAHESGIHQHGVLANAKTYEIMTRESVGAQASSLVLGKHSGKHAFRARLKELGYTLDDDRIETLFEAFKSLCDRKKAVTDRDLCALAENTASAVDGIGDDSRWVLESFVVNSGNRMSSSAVVTLRKGKKSVQEVALGTGPVYAALRAVEKIVKHPFSLDDYQLQAVTEHRDALGEAQVKLSDATGTYRGRGLSTDVIEASLLACLSAVNSMLSNGHALGTGAASNAQHQFAEDMLAGHSDKPL